MLMDCLNPGLVMSLPPCCLFSLQLITVRTLASLLSVCMASPICVLSLLAHIFCLMALPHVLLFGHLLTRFPS
ncbi:hypothetical protein BC826DRAFT_1053048 [Russula brevipes]|nr:hypothetical protein BC826DRAFT_1053048 [Russula brevipes]